MGKCDTPNTQEFSRLSLDRNRELFHGFSLVYILYTILRDCAHYFEKKIVRIEMVALHRTYTYPCKYLQICILWASCK